MSNRTMATLLMTGILAVLQGQPAFASVRGAELRTNVPLVRNGPTVPTCPVRVKGGNISEGSRTPRFAFLELDGTSYGVVRTLLFVILR